MGSLSRPTPTPCRCCHAHSGPHSRVAARQPAVRRHVSGGGGTGGTEHQTSLAAACQSCPAPAADQAAPTSRAATQAAALAASLAAAAATAGGAAAEVLDLNGQPFVPPTASELGWEVWVGFVAGVIPFLIASFEFGKRILIQRRCPSCRGSGLVQRGRRLVKCPECGGMLPWISWRLFLLGTATNPGNGGPLLQPRGQTSVLYTVPPPLEAQQARAAGNGQEPAGQPGDAEQQAAKAEAARREQQ